MTLHADTVWEMRTTGSNTNGGGVYSQNLRCGKYRWSLSSGGTNEYYCELANGGDPSLSAPATVQFGYVKAAAGAAGSLAAGEWDYGDNDTLGYSTVYVRLSDNAAPDTKARGYVRRLKGEDYSQQTSAQLSLSDLAMTAGTVVVTSATGGFTSSMDGNLIYISGGTNFTAGWYEITEVTDTNTATVDRDATNGSNASGGGGAVGGCLASPTLAISDAFESGNEWWLKAGTYTLTHNFTNWSRGANYSRLFGYNTTRGDSPTENDRPLISCGAYEMYIRYWLEVKDIRLSGTTYYQVLYGGYSNENVYAENTSASTNREALKPTEQGVAARCEAISTNGNAYEFTRSSLLDSVARDSVRGISCYEDSVIRGCIIRNNTNGIYCNYRQHGSLIEKNTIFENGHGIYMVESRRNRIADNLIECNTEGIDHLNASGGIMAANNWHANDTDITAVVAAYGGVEKSHNATAHDPDFEDAANGDFRLKPGSPCATAGMPITVGTGGNSITTHQGAVPPIASSGAGGTDAGPFDQQFVR